MQKCRGGRGKKDLLEEEKLRLRPQGQKARRQEEESGGSVPGRGRHAGENPDARERMCAQSIGGELGLWSR